MELFKFVTNDLRSVEITPYGKKHTLQWQVGRAVNHENNVNADISILSALTEIPVIGGLSSTEALLIKIEVQGIPNDFGSYKKIGNEVTITQAWKWGLKDSTDLLIYSLESTLPFFKKDLIKAQEYFKLLQDCKVEIDNPVYRSLPDPFLSPQNTAKYPLIAQLNRVFDEIGAYHYDGESKDPYYVADEALWGVLYALRGNLFECSRRANYTSWSASVAINETFGISLNHEAWLNRVDSFFQNKLATLPIVS